MRRGAGLARLAVFVVLVTLLLATIVTQGGAVLRKDDEKPAGDSAASLRASKKRLTGLPKREPEHQRQETRDEEEDGDLASVERCYDAVDILLGTTLNSDAKLVPSVGVPFGNLLVGPETEVGEPKCVPYYYYERSFLRGVRLSHWMSGSCTQDYGSFSVRPGFSGVFGSHYVHSKEKGEPAQYHVWDLFDGQVNMTTAANSHSALVRFDLTPSAAPFEIEIGANRGDAGCKWDAGAHVLTCTNTVYRMYTGNGLRAGFASHLYLDVDPLPKEVVKGADGGAVLRFTSDVRRVVVRGAVSNLDSEGAANNLRAEVGSTFEVAEVAAIAKRAWLAEIGKVRVGADARDRDLAKFYTAIYHASLLPREFSDVDGRFPSFGGGRTTHQWPSGQIYYEDYSAWDTFRALHPFHTIVNPSRSVDFARSLVQKGKDGGWLPIFPAWNSYTGEMIGDHLIAILGDFINKGLLDEEPELIREAYRLMRQNANESPRDTDYYMEGKGRRSLQAYKRLGYVPLEEENLMAFHPFEQSSRTIEYSMDDAVLASVACSSRINDTKTCEQMTARAKNFQNVIDRDFGFVNGRHADGRFQSTTNLDPAMPQRFVTEGTPWQWTFAPMHDVQGLMDALGLDAAGFESKLDRFFQLKQYDHNNEPSHHIAFMYNFVGAYHKTQAHVHAIRDELYSTGPAGLLGNDDAGQISAWFIFAAMGLYQVSPHRPVFQVFQPLFSRVELHLESGRVFTVSAPELRDVDTQDQFFLEAAAVDGACIHLAEISFEQIAAGSTLALNVSKTKPSRPFVQNCALPPRETAVAL